MGRLLASVALACLLMPASALAASGACGQFGSDALADAFDKVSPSVVGLSIQRAPGSPSAMGAGLVWDATGHIVTNDHVVAQGERITVTLADGSRRTVQRLARDTAHDLAVLKVTGRLPAPVDRGRSTSLRIGQWVMAVGNPYGLGSSLSVGIVSGLNRAIDSTNGTRLEGMVQTDALLNPGNSGGALFDCGGRLVGVTTAVSPPGPGPGGIGFAIGVDEAAAVVNRLITEIKLGKGLQVAETP
ncbi:MAG TPA: trypsin-like peptidase domain-containing protein [Azospirillaceae bacterium]|nr:trypsin-like peptidase domain-containing protein [Azospirillaceae bacterium]